MPKNTPTMANPDACVGLSGFLIFLSKHVFGIGFIISYSIFALRKTFSVS